VAGAVGDDEVAMRRGEVAVGDVDRDALLALGPQPIGEQGQVDVVVATALADRRDVFELVLEDRLRVVGSRPMSVDSPSSTLPTVAKWSGWVVRAVSLAEVRSGVSAHTTRAGPVG